MEFLAVVQKLEDDRLLLDMLRERAQTLGFGAIAYFRPAASDLGRIEIEERGFPEGWADRYRHDRLDLIDPHLSYVAQTGRTVQFSEIGNKRALAAPQIAFLEMCDDAGLTDGFLVPAFGIYAMPTFGLFPYLGWIAFRQIASPDVIADTNIAYLEAIAQATHVQHIRVTIGKQADRPRFSPREIAILNWIAKGKTNNEIATILSIAGPTVATYVRRIFQKLDVVDRASAAVAGMKLGLVHA